MTIEIQGIARNRALRARVMDQMEEALGRLGVAPVTAHVTFTDDNGPKGGPDIRCGMTVKLPYKPAIRVEQVAETARLAFDGGFEALLRRLERYRERARDNRRHPKKYYAAKQVNTGEPRGARSAGKRG
jgi:ribosome-associated translation inhibitor RaiA